MNDKLNSSLDDILKTSRNTRRGGRDGRRAGGGRRAEAPVGGVSKAVKQAKPANKKAAPVAPVASTGGETKLMISNLPTDITEAQIREYFKDHVKINHLKRVIVHYGPNGQSLGSVTVIFHKAEDAGQATAALEGIKIDKKPLRVEMLISAAKVPVQAQPSLADRVSQPKKDKPKPKPATTNKAAPSGGRGRGNGRGRGRGGRERSKKKTQEELDAEMEDYFPSTESNDAMVTNGDAAQATAGGDTNMDDDQML